MLTFLALHSSRPEFWLDHNLGTLKMTSKQSLFGPHVLRFGAREPGSAPKLDRYWPHARKRVPEPDKHDRSQLFWVLRSEVQQDVDKSIRWSSLTSTYSL